MFSNVYALTAAATDALGKFPDVAGSSAFSLERLSMAGQMILIGLGMVFVVLAILWLVLVLFKFIFAKPEPKKKPQSAPIETPPAVVDNLPTVEEQKDDGELIAVITAAVAAYIESEEPDAYQGGFRVVSFRRANGGRSWNAK